MSEDDSAQPDPIADVDEMDIDTLLERTRELAAKASEEVGPPAEAPPSDAPSDVTEATTAEDASEAETPALDGSSSKRPDPSASDEVPSSADGADDVTAQLAELESMLSQTGQKVSEPAGAEPANDAPAPETAPAAEGDEQDFEDFDDFDISVDLSGDEEDTVDGEIESKSSEAANGDAEAPSVAAEDAVPLVTRILDGGLRIVGRVFVALDSPFGRMSSETKQVMAYIAIATFLVSVGGLIYSSVVY